MAHGNSYPAVSSQMWATSAPPWGLMKCLEWLTVGAKPVRRAMSFLKSLFGRPDKESGEPASAPVAQQIEHKGFVIQATPYKEAGQYQTSGLVAKDIDGVRREHKFIRADRFASLDEAVDCALSKGRQIVDEMGERLFR